MTSIGNTYAASSPLGLCALLDQAGPEKRILLVSFGSGAGSDAFVLQTTDALSTIRGRAPLFEAHRQKKATIDYGTYVKLRKKLRV